jgi:hypothetical protein
LCWVSAKANRSPLVKKLNLHASKASSLQEAVLIMPMVLLLNFVSLLTETAHLSQTYPHIIQIAGEKLKIEGEFRILQSVLTRIPMRTIVVGIGASKLLLLTDYCHLCNHTQNHFLKTTHNQKILTIK